MGLKQDLLRQADEELARLRAALAGLDDEAMTRVWLGTWARARSSPTSRRGTVR